MGKQQSEVSISVSSTADDMPAHSRKVEGQGSLTSVLPKWWRLCKLWFTGEERWKACGFAASVVALSFVTTLFLVKISYAQRNFSTALSEKNIPGFHRAVWDFVVIICIAAPLFSFNGFVQDRLVLAWRTYLTKVMLKAYFDNKSYFHLRQSADRLGNMIDNPDQRICDDVAAFCRSSTTITLTLVKKVFNCVAFAGVLWSVSSSLVVFMFVYALVGTVLTTSVFGKVLSVLYFKLLAREGDLRFSLVRVREHAESVAFYRGERQERKVVSGRLKAVLDTARDRIRWVALYDLWTSVYEYATILAPSLLTAPRYFKGEIEFGVISQASFAFQSIEKALSIIINNLTLLTGLAAEADRLDALLAAMNANGAAAAAAESRAAGAGGGGSTGSSDSLAAQLAALSTEQVQRLLLPEQQGLCLNRLSVIVPGTQRTIWRDVDLVLEQGQSLLVVGPSGCGKSSLLRCLAGLWSEGSGSARLPPSSHIFFLPQKPFMTLGNLRQQLTFPSGAAHGDGGDDLWGASGDQASGPGSAGLLAELLEMIGLGSMPNTKRHAARSADQELEAAPLLRKDDTGVARGTAGSAVQRREAAGSSSQVQGGSHVEEGEQGVGCGPVGVEQVADKALASLLEDVCLPDLLSKVGGFDAELDWSHVLSSGEQQRVAFLRLLLHTPRLAFLDEATSAVDAPTEAKLYNLLKRAVPCYVSVGHRMQLLRHHTHVLEHQGSGSGAWTLWPAAEYQKKMEASVML